MHLRSLALLLFVFAASAAFAGYLGMKYGEVTPQRAVQSREPAPELVLQSAKPDALLRIRPARPIRIEARGVYSPGDGQHADTNARFTTGF